MDREDAELEARAARLREMTTPAAFDVGFADRVMARLAQAPLHAAPSMPDELQRVFFRLAPLAAAAVLALAAMNLRSTRATDQPILERVLGLPAVTLAAAYTMESGQ